MSLPPVQVATIPDICGNSGGWQPFSAAELASRYGDVEGYLAERASAVDAQVATGHLAAGEREGMLATARAAYTSAR